MVPVYTYAQSDSWAFFCVHNDSDQKIVISILVVLFKKDKDKTCDPNQK